MAMKTMNAGMIRKMFLAGAANIEAKKEFINELRWIPESRVSGFLSLVILQVRPSC